MALAKILVIDDDIDICHLLKRFLGKNSYEVATAHSGETGIAQVEDFQPDLVMTDFRLGDMDGSAVISRIKAILPQVPILVITGYSDIRTAINVMKLGATDYITKPILPQEILLTIQRVLAEPPTATVSRAAAADEALSSPAAGAETPSATPIVREARLAPNNAPFVTGQSAAAQTLYKQIDLVAPTNYSVIIFGESGAGKEAVARMVHDRSQRAKMPFVAMDCGAIPKELANSELFGHEKGSFTGAVTQKIGLFEMANGGTIFLDEVANLSYDVQVTLLRVVQERKMKRIGSNKEINLDVRIIVASNERLYEAARKGKFREDLYHRFNEFSIDVPPLRERVADIMTFAQHFLEQTSKDLGRKMVGFEPDVVPIFQSYPWYGNVRELKNIIKRAALLSDGEYVQVKALPFELTNHSKLNYADTYAPEHAVYQAPQEPMPTESFSSAPVYATYTPPPVVSHPQVPAAAAPKNPPINLKEAARDAEYEAILATLQQARYNKSKAAEILGIDRKTLYNKLKKYGIE